MTLDATVRYTDFKSSIKKYFIDSLETIDGVKLFFDWLDDVPTNAGGTKLSQWIIFDIGGLGLGSVADCAVVLHLFTRVDLEGDKLALLHDLVMNRIIDESAPNGLHVIPYYDITTGPPWTQVGGIIPYPIRSFPDENGDDGTKIKTTQLLCKWGSK